MGIDPVAVLPSSASELAAEGATLEAGLLALLPLRLASLLAVREFARLLSMLSKASSTTPALPLCVRTPASTFQISYKCDRREAKAKGDVNTVFRC